MAESVIVHVVARVTGAGAVYGSNCIRPAGDTAVEGIGRAGGAAEVAVDIGAVALRVEGVAGVAGAGSVEVQIGVQLAGGTACAAWVLAVVTEDVAPGAVAVVVHIEAAAADTGVVGHLEGVGLAGDALSLERAVAGTAGVVARKSYTVSIYISLEARVTDAVALLVSGSVLAACQAAGGEARAAGEAVAVTGLAESVGVHVVAGVAEAGSRGGQEGIASAGQARSRRGA